MKGVRIVKGTVISYNIENQIGYIKGYDDDVYIFRGRDVKENIELKEGDTVDFDFTIYDMEELPVAELIRKENI